MSMEKLRTYAHMIKRYMDREERKPAERPAYDTEPYTAGEWYAIHLQAESWREDFKDLCRDIAERFTAGEWNKGHEAEIERLLADIADRDKPTLIQALAIDAFLANAPEAEIEQFNRLARYQHDNREPEGEALKKRGFSDGKYLGIFTTDLQGDS